MQIKYLGTLVAAGIIAASGSYVLAKQSPAPAVASPADAPHASLAGQWHFNKELSTPPPDVADAPESEGRRPPRGGSGGFGGRGGRGGFGGRGGYGGGAYGGGSQGNPEDMLKMRALMRELSDAPQLLTVVVAPDAVTFTDERGSTHRYRTDGKKEEIEFGPSVKVDAKTRWEGDVLSQEFSVGRMKVTENYQVTVQGHMLVATIQRTSDQNSGGRVQTTPIKFVFERGE